MKRVFISQFDAPSSIRDKILESLTWIGWDAIVKPGATIFIKPNLTYPYYKPGVTTSPEFMKAIVSILSTQSTNVIIGESDGGYNSWKAEEAFQGHQLYEIAEKHSAKVVNLSKLKSEYIETRVGSKKVKVELPSLLLHEIDVFITVPVPKLHCMTGVSLGFKNQWGCIPNTMRLRNHPEFNKKIVAINKLVRKDERLGMKMIYKEYYKGKTVLVTGGAGAIGSNLSRTLAEQGAFVIVFDDFSSAERWNVPSLSGVLLADGNILDEIKLKRVFLEKPQIIFHLAAFFANQNSVDHPETDLMVNGLGTLKLLQYSQLSGVERFVYASSGCSIYGSESPLPLTEEFMSLNLSSPYQITKMLGELYCNFFHNHYGLKCVKPRFFNSYGPGEVPGQYRNVIPNFIYWAMKELSLPITGTGEETRDFTYVGDIVDGLLRAGYFDEAVGEEFNLASGKETKIIDLAKMVNDITGNKAPIKFLERRKWDTKTRLLASVDKARTLIGYEPNTPFEEGLKNTVEWFRENWDRIQESARFGPGMSSAVRGIVQEK